VGLSSLPTRWDSAEHLKTEEDIQLYLEACLEEADGDPALIIHAFGVIARARNMSQLARDTGLSREGLYKALSPGGKPTICIFIQNIILYYECSREKIVYETKDRLVSHRRGKPYGR
jgi:probable addiction module antidote protein